MSSSRRVILVEPAHALRSDWQALFAERGYEVVIADGLPGVPGEDHPDHVLIVDSGYLTELSDQELATLSTRWGAVVVIADSAELDARANTPLPPSFDFICKPVHPQELLMRAQQCFTRIENAPPRMPASVLGDQALQLGSAISLPFTPEKTRTSVGAAVHILELLADRLQAGGGSFFAVEEQGLHRLHSLEGEHGPEFIRYPLAESSVFHLVMHEKRAILVQDINRQDTIRRSGWDGYRDPSLLVFPLLDDSGEVSAIVSLHNKEWPPFTNEDLRLGVLEATYSSHVFEARKMAEDAEASRKIAKKERDLANTLIEFSPTYFIILDSEGRIRMMNPAMLSATGYSEAEVLGRRYVDIFVRPDRRETATELIEVLVKSTRPGVREWNVLTKSGNTLLVEWQHRAVPEPGNGDIIIFAVGKDVTLYKKALNALEHSQILFRSVLDHVQEGTLIADKSLRVVFVNARFTALSGSLYGELIGSEARDALRGLVGETAAAEMDLLIRKCSAERRSISGRMFSGKPLKGERRWFELRCTPIDLPDEERIVVQLADVTRRRRAQRALVDREKRLRTLVRTAPLGILAIDDTGQIVELNRKVLEILGSPSEEFTRSRNTLTYPPLIEAGFSTDLRKCLRTGEAVAGEMEYQGHWGNETVIRYHLTPLATRDERVTQVQAILEDITERRRLEKQILHTQKMESLGTLTGGIAHEYNNLLQVIQGYTEILALETSSAGQVPIELQEIQSATARATELTSHLLTFSCNTEVSLRPIDLNREIAESTEILRKSLLQFAEVHLDLDPNLPTIMADAAQVRKILTNLALNAKDALPQHGEIVITTTTTTVVPDDTEFRDAVAPGRYVNLQFRDNGSGIHPDDAKSIFDPFFTTKSSGQRHGLGLSVVYGIVKAHNGFLEWRSTPGQGTIFDLFFPVVELSDTRPVVQGATGNPTSAGSQGAGTILFADDEPALRSLVKQYLTSLGHTVVTAENGEEALRLFQESRGAIDVVILDLIMPKGGGDWCLKEMLKLDPSQTVLIASGYSLSASAEELTRAGARGFIEKPYDLLELSGAISRLLGHRGDQEEPAER